MKTKSLAVTIAGAITVLFTAVTPLHADLSTGLVAYYPLNGNANDASGNGNNGTNEFATSTTDRFGVAGQALEFDGATSRVRIPDAAQLRLSGTDFTISTWIYETQRNADYVDAILSKRLRETSSSGWHVGITGFNETNPGLLEYQVSNGTDPRMYSVTVLSLNTWHHVTVVYEASTQSLQMFIDGVLDSTGYSLPSPNGSATSELHIGHDSSGGTSGYFFHGKIDEVRIYNRALSNSEIWTLYADSDGDAVTDVEDQCPNTAAGSIVDPHGCSIDQLVPCAGPLSGGAWKNHGQYVASVAKKVEEFLAAGLIKEVAAEAFVSQAARSSCGK